MTIWSSGDSLSPSLLNTRRPSWSSAVPFFDISQFGAALDGVTNDQPAWTSAISAANAAGGVVWHPGTGVSLVTAPIVLPAGFNTVIRGAGTDNAVIRASGAASVFSCTHSHLTTEWHSQIADLSIDGGGTVGPTLNLTGCTKLMLQNLRVYNCAGSGAKLTSHFDSIFFNLFFSGTGGNVGSANSAVVVLDGSIGNEFDECSFYRLHIEPGTANAIYLDLQGTGANTVRFSDFYYTKLAGVPGTGAPTGVPLLRTSVNANDNYFFGGTMAYCNGAPQVQMDGSRNRIQGMSHIVGSPAPTYAYAVGTVGASNDNAIIAHASQSNAYTNGLFQVGANGSRTRISVAGFNTSITTVINNSANATQTEYAQPNSRFAPTDGSTVTPNAALATHQDLFYGGTPRTVAAALNAIDGMEMDITIKNNTGSAVSTIWASGTGGYSLAGTWVDPGAGKRRNVRFRYVGYDNKWVEMSRTGADV